MVNLLKGDILATTRTSLNLLASVLGGVVLVLFAFRKEFLLVSFDRDLAVVFGKRVALWDALLYLTISVVAGSGRPLSCGSAGCGEVPATAEAAGPRLRRGDDVPRASARDSSSGSA